MKAKLLTIAAIFVVASACKKDTFETKPKLEFKSVNATTFAQGNTVSFVIEFTDKEGDLGEGKLIFLPKRINRRPLPPSIPDYDTIYNDLPDFPNKTKGDMEIRLQWNFLHKSDIENDTIFFRFVAIDRKGNKSDTLDSEQFVILRQ